MDAVLDDRPLLVSRPECPRYYAPWFSRAVINDLLRHALMERIRISICCPFRVKAVTYRVAAASRMVCSSRQHTMVHMNYAEVG